MGVDGTVIRTYGANQDITERKEMENALRESRHQLFDIIDFLPDPTFVIDNKGKVISWNLAIQNLSGIPPEAILGKGDYEYAFRLFGERRPLLIDLVIHMDSEELQKHYKNTRQDGKILRPVPRTVPVGKTSRSLDRRNPSFQSNWRNRWRDRIHPGISPQSKKLRMISRNSPTLLSNACRTGPGNLTMRERYAQPDRSGSRSSCPYRYRWQDKGCQQGR